MCRHLFIAVFLLYSFNLCGQDPVILTVTDSVTHESIPLVTISVKGKAMAVTDSTGTAYFRLLKGTHLLLCSYIGYHEKEVSVTVPGNGMIQVFLTREQTSLEDVTILSSTRNNQRMENAPLKVEVLGREEMEEENTIKPANIASILGDISGIQIQQSSAVTGNANVRIQGLEGRYTLLLRDGMPLFDGFSGGFGILSIPPLDLKQIELIKGSASTLFGGGAIGGLINIISRRPTSKQDLTLTLNQTTLDESNLNVYVAKRNKHYGYNFFGGTSLQKAVDVNKDGISDVTKLRSIVLHPRLFFYPDDNTTLITGYTLTRENRLGGDMLVISNNAGPGHRFFEKNKTARHSGELIFERKMKAGKRLDIKTGLSSFNRAITTDTHFFNGNQLNYFTEAALLIPSGHNSLVAGINLLGDRFKQLPSDTILLSRFSNNTAGVFIQNTWQISDNRLLELGLRFDHHNRYGSFLLPRISFFNRFDEHWATRFGIGLGYKTPNPLATQITDVAIALIQPLPSTIKAERSAGYNAEINYKRKWGGHNTLFINHAFFLTQINQPVIATLLSSGEMTFSNANKPVVTKGFDTYIQLSIAGWECYAGYTFTIAERKYLRNNQFMPLTPKNRMAFTLVKEFAENWRLGLEGSYNGKQYRPDASKTPAYFFMAGLLERQFGKHVTVVINGENLLDYRQSKNEPLYSGSITNPVFAALWAPVDGRVFNLALRIKL